MEYYENIKEAVTNLTNRIKLFSRVLTVIFMGLLLYSCANGDEIESDKTEEIAEYEDQIDEITDFIDEQTDLEVNTFQTNLLTWLNNKNNVQKATINNDKSLITVKFKNGYDFYINFQDMAFFHDDENEQNSVTDANISRAREKFDYYDVSYQNDEKIIEQNKLLYIQGRNMTIGGILSNANKEKGLIEDRISESPMKCELITAPRTQFLTENLKDYGIILISQTHGIWGLNGAFQVEGDIKNIPVEYRLDVYTLYVQNNLIIQDTENKKYSTIMSDFLSIKLSGNQDAIIYGNYCWSFGLASKIKNTVYGYITEKPYYYFWDNMNIFLARMLNGDTFHNTYKDISGEIDKGEYNVIPNTNNPNSKQRYFSISTDEITNTNTNQPKISGKINGYENLKKDELTYLVYFHEGDADFSPKSAKDDECIILKTPEYPNLTTFSIDSEGNFSFDFPGWLKANTKYRIAFAFEYKDAIYYGEKV